MKPFPPLRNIEAVPFEQEGNTLIVLHDPTGYVEAQITLSPPAFFIAACLDGQHGIREIQLDFAHQYDGVILPAEQIHSVVNFLDEQGFLYSDRFESLKNSIEEQFRNAPVRRAYLSGNGYPQQRAALGEFVSTMFSRPGGPGHLPNTPGTQDPPVRCLIAPHIDFHRGALGYAHAYHHLYRHRSPETVIIFGVAHAGAPVPYILTQKDFETPFGTLRNNRDMVQRLSAACAWNPYAYEPIHRTEHSIEFQAILLAYLYGTDVNIVPILCAQLESPEESGESRIPDRTRRFLSECAKVVEEYDGRITVIAGADLAHVGRRFGDHFDITDLVVRHVSDRDAEDLQQVVNHSAEGFYASVMRDNNARRVCGLGCIYSAMKTVENVAQTGELLHWGHAPDPAGGMVSFVSAKLT